MSDFKSYEFSVKIRTNRKPKEELWRIVQKLKDVVPVLSIEYNLIDDRPTTVEHHGGTDEKIPYENQKEVDAYMKQRALNNDNTKLSTSQQESSEADIETPSY